MLNCRWNGVPEIRFHPNPDQNPPINAPGDLHWGIAISGKIYRIYARKSGLTNKRQDDGLSGIRQEMTNLAGDSRQD